VPRLRADRPDAGTVLLYATALYSIVLLLIAACAFIVVPRSWSNGLFGGMRRLMPVSLTGMSEEVRLQSTPIVEDESVVLRAGLPVADRWSRSGVFSIPARSDVRPLPRRPLASNAGGVGGRFPGGAPQTPTPLAAAGDPVRSDEVTEQQVWLEDTVDGTSSSSTRRWHRLRGC